MTAASAHVPEPHGDYRGLDRDKLSPMMQHYIEVKEQYPQALLLYRVGDFFECFFQDAVTIAQELELVLTSKEGGKEIGRVRMTGVPHHALERYAALLVEKGYAVAICDQVEDATIAAAEKRMVRREVQQLITPGTLTEEGMLSARRNNFLAAVVLVKHHWGLAYADITTGEFYTTQGTGLEALAMELERLQPSEVLLPTDAPDVGRLLRPGQGDELIPAQLPSELCYTTRSHRYFTAPEARNRLMETFQVRSLEAMGCADQTLAMRAAGGLLEYIEDTQKDNRAPLQPLKTYAITDYLILDPQTRRNLELMQTVRDRATTGSLLWALDRTNTAMGGRALKRWFLEPLLDPKGILARQETIAELIAHNGLREDLKTLLRQFYDLERLSGRAASGRANARELVNLADSLVRLVQLASLAQQGQSPYLKALHQIRPTLEQVGQYVLDRIQEAPPLHIKEGGVIRDGIDPRLDQRRSQLLADQQWLADLEIRERERTGVNKLKVGYNKTFGYYLTLPRAQADAAPSDYTRKQTLANEERYITPELKERETRILTAQDDLNEIEYEIFQELRGMVGEQAQEIRDVARAVAALDVLVGLAEVAIAHNYCRPMITQGREIEINQGRHPVVEQRLKQQFFVPNSTHMGYEPQRQDSPDLIILTGPNASGKSCYLRQVGLIQIMAQTGSYVPAQGAKLGICDRIFTRVGAVDDLATGQSTFMVEMNETANILNHATAKSLVLLDEIGRGTATFDGLSIAWAVAEYLAQTIQSRTIFATHYHELNELETLCPNVANYQVTVKELPDKIIFLHEVHPGGADRSYGIEAGRLAGLPDVVIQRAHQVMGQIEKHSKIAVGLRKGSPKRLDPALAPDHRVEQLDIFGDRP
ncbi:DNA mismatch repair protein MutS [Spirulina sp. CCNP1310]|uniref:DNA mismatch repair protein MutS n=1 Tax=Spirulina sp. CCNP1310 TaxID=3110249 RepID=UPI002B1E983F|nr:DNA mismatch repair protein MutS [Spirulina sp. CCNP1310]MEA5418581.1 DNA mismatch repair protein MutS [Spirulina sp. CCNP1310]